MSALAAFRPATVTANAAIMAAATAALAATPARASATPLPTPPLSATSPMASGPFPGSDGRSAIDPSQLCRAAIAATERTTGIPDAFLSAIGRVESGRDDGGVRNPWPWTVNEAGVGHFYGTKQAAIDAVRQFLAAGVKSVDVGCLQVNLQFHPDAFQGLEQAFDPADNAAYAGRLLLELYGSTGSWPRAAAAYHSMTPGLGSAYLQRVLEQWSLPDRAPAAPGRARRDGAAEQARRPASPGMSPPVAAGLATADRRGAMPATPPPSFGFSRRFMLPQGPGQGRMLAGRTLAAYRAVPIRVAIGQIGRVR